MSFEARFTNLFFKYVNYERLNGLNASHGIIHDVKLSKE